VSKEVAEEADELSAVSAATGSPDKMYWYPSPLAAVSGAAAITDTSAAAAAFFFVIVVSPGLV
jgi:hypothetical protein